MSTARYVDELVMKADTADTVSKMSSMGGTFRAVSAGITAGAAAMSAAGFQAGKDWDTATKTIIDGTGATGEKLRALQGDYQELARFGPSEAATAVADLNTHLGYQGDEMIAVGTAALKMKVDTNLAGGVIKQLGLDASGAVAFLDNLRAAQQATGVESDVLLRTIGKSSARWQAAGGDMEGLTATVVQAAQEFGPAGLRGAMSEILQEVDKGVIPATVSLERQLGNTTGAVERSYQEGRTWRDVLRETKDSIIATVGPYGDMVGAMGSVTTAAFGFLTAFPGAAGLVSTAARGMWVALTGPVGLVVGGIALLGTTLYATSDTFRDFVNNAWRKFLDAIKSGYNWIAGFIPGLEEIADTAEFETAPAMEQVAVEAAPIPSIMDSIATSTSARVVPAVKELKSAIDDMTGPGGSFETLSREAQEIFSNRLVEEFASGGTASADTWYLGFMSGPGGIGTRLPHGAAEMLAHNHDQTVAGFGATATDSAGGFMSRLSGILGGGGESGGITGFFQNTMGGVSGIMSQFLNGDWKSTLGNMVSMGLNTLVPGLGTIANQAFAAFKAAWDWFKKPSETELAARETWTAIGTTVVDTLRGTQEFSAEVDRAMADGWDRSTAEMRAAFVLLGQQSGMTYDEAFENYAVYEQAVRDGDVELSEQMLATLQGWEEQYGTTWATNVETTAQATGAIQASIDAVEGKDVRINVSHHTHYSSSGSSGPPGGGGGGEGAGPSAAGGFLRAGVPRTVGEHGIEVFRPSSDGWLTPNHALRAGGGLGGTIVIQNHLDGEVVSEQTIRLDQRMRDRIGIGEA